MNIHHMVFSIFLLLHAVGGLFVQIPMVSLTGGSATFVTPALTPELLEDPQNLPRGMNLFFRFEKGGVVTVDLDFRPLQAAQRQPKSFLAPEALIFPAIIARNLQAAANDAVLSQYLHPRGLSGSGNEGLGGGLGLSFPEWKELSGDVSLALRTWFLSRTSWWAMKAAFVVSMPGLPPYLPGRDTWKRMASSRFRAVDTESDTNSNRNPLNFVVQRLKKFRRNFARNFLGTRLQTVDGSGSLGSLSIDDTDLLDHLQSPHVDSVDADFPVANLIIPATPIVALIDVLYPLPRFSLSDSEKQKHHWVMPCGESATARFAVVEEGASLVTWPDWTLEKEGLDGKGSMAAEVSVSAARNRVESCNVRWCPFNGSCNDEAGNSTEPRGLSVGEEEVDGIYEETETAEFLADACIFLMSIEQWRSARTTILSRLSSSSAEAYTWNSMLRSELRVPITQSKVRLTHEISDSGRYFFFILNPRSIPYELGGTLSLVNPDGQQLSVDQYHDGVVAISMCILYTSIFFVMMICFLTIWRKKPKAIMQLLALAVGLKAFYLFLDYRAISLFSLHGITTTFTIVFPKIISKAQDITTLITFLLLSLGWRTVRSELTATEVKFCAGIAVLSSYLGAFEISMGGFQVSRYILHALSYLCIIITINFNIAIINSRIMQLELGERAARAYDHLKAFGLLRWIFIGYIVKPSVLLFYKLSVVRDEDEPWNSWLVAVADLIADAAILVATAYAFRPTSGLKLIKYAMSWRYPTEEAESDGSDEEGSPPEHLPDS